MKKIILITLLAIAGTVFTNANAATRTKNANHNLSQRKQNYAVNEFKPEYVFFTSNGSLYVNITEFGISWLYFIGWDGVFVLIGTYQ